jgi:hypothetical protein
MVPIFKSQKIQKELTDWLQKMGPTRCPETPVTINQRCVTSQTSEDLICTAVKVWNNADLFFNLKIFILLLILTPPWRSETAAPLPPTITALHTWPSCTKLVEQCEFRTDYMKCHIQGLIVVKFRVLWCKQNKTADVGANLPDCTVT